MSESSSYQNGSGTDPLSWVKTYGDYLYNYAYSRLRDESAAEDAVQETFLAALKAREKFGGRSSERTWLTGILKHKVVDSIRKRFRGQPNSDENPLPAEKEHVMNPPDGDWAGHWAPDRTPIDWGNKPDTYLENKEFWEILDACLKGLPERFAAVFALHQMEELPSADICKELDITTTNLWVMLHRTRRQLRRCLEINWIGTEDPKRRSRE